MLLDAVRRGPAGAVRNRRICGRRAREFAWPLAQDLQLSRPNIAESSGGRVSFCA
ncbi:hypothetical protein BVI434_270066 [Burkholderia vietnamiensis]|nr:hypothetical protein BVI434_270066 [Burkholderia vietnamiensis]